MGRGLWLTVRGDAVHLGGEGTVAAVEGYWPHFIHSQKAKVRQKMGSNYKTSRPRPP